MLIQAPIPILRMFDVAKAREFYCDYLSFEVVFEHRFEPTAPLYMGLARGRCRIDLSEHYGDACPGSAIRINVSDVDALCRELTAKHYAYYRVSIIDQSWGAREMRVLDPFGNRLVFFSSL